MKLLTVESYANRHGCTNKEVFYASWMYYHGSTSFAALHSIDRDFELWQETKKIPKYVSDHIREN